MTRYRVTHTTEYRYAAAVSQCQNEAHLLPRSTPRQQCESEDLQIRPWPALRHDRHDFFGNRATYFAVHEPHDVLSVTVESRVRINADSPPDVQASPSWEAVARALDEDTSPTGLDARQFRLASPLIADTLDVAAYAAVSFPAGRPVLTAVADLIERIHNEFVYDPNMTNVSTPVGVVMEHRRGVCQDFAHLAIGCLRSRGLAARYVSGYVETAPAGDQPKLTGAAASHAWVSVYCPGLGWTDFDPTNDCRPTDQHVTVAWGRDYGDVTPLKGVVTGGGDHTLAVRVNVERLA